MTFSVDGFDAVSLSPRNSARNFPLQVESYDTTGEVHYVLGVDLSSGAEQRRVRVFLREMRKEGATKNRPGIIHYATDPFAGLSDADLRDRKKMEQINASLEAKCFTAPGGVLMVQSAFDDKASGAVSASWLNRVTNADDLHDGSAVLIAPAVARLSTPYFPREGETGTTYCYCDVLHPEKATVARTPKEMDEQLFNALSVSPSDAGGKFLAVIRLVDTSTGKTSAKLLERRAEKDDNNQYVNETPATSISRFWSALPASFAEGLKEAITDKQVEVVIIPGTRYRLVGKTLEAVEKESGKRMHLPYERFALGDARDSGFMESTVVLKRFRADDNHPAGDEDYFLTAIYPATTGDKAASLSTLTL